MAATADRHGPSPTHYRVMLTRVLRAYGLVFPLIFAVAFAVQWNRTDAGRDTAILYVGAANPSVGKSIYHPIPEPGVFRQDPVYNYPPPLAAVLQPLTHLGFKAFARVWLVLISIAYFAFAASLARMARVGTLTAAGLLWLCPGVVQAWNMGNADVIVWALVGWGFLHPWLLAPAAVLKVLPCWAWGFRALRDRRTLLYGLAFVGLAFGISATVGLEEWRVWLAHIVPTLSQGEWWIASGQTWTLLGVELPTLSPGNLSLSFLPLQVYREAGNLPAWGRLYLTVASIGVPLVVGYRMRGAPMDRQMAAVLVASVLLAPILRLSYLPLLIPCLLILRRTPVAAAGRARNRYVSMPSPVAPS